MEMKEFGKCNATETHVKKSIMMGIPCPPICVVHLWQEDVRVRFYHIIGISGIFDKIRGPCFYEIWFFHIQINTRKVLEFLDFWVSRGREAYKGWSFLFNLSVDQGREKNVYCFLVFSFLIYVADGLEERGG